GRGRGVGLEREIERTVLTDRDPRDQRGAVKQLARAVARNAPAPGLEPRGEAHGVLSVEVREATGDEIEFVAQTLDQGTLGDLVAHGHGSREMDQLALFDARHRRVAVRDGRAHGQGVAVLPEFDRDAWWDPAGGRG